jgi:hypothetical protein
MITINLLMMNGLNNMKMKKMRNIAEETLDLRQGWVNSPLHLVIEILRTVQIKNIPHFITRKMIFPISMRIRKIILLKTEIEDIIPKRT